MATFDVISWLLGSIVSQGLTFKVVYQREDRTGVLGILRGKVEGREYEITLRELKGKQ